MSDNAFLVDTTKCTGCRACQVACKQWNGLPAEKTDFFGGTEYTNPGQLSAQTWNHVVFNKLDRTSGINPIWSLVHKKCYHCKDANCQRICPEKAISKVNGWTIIDQSKCIGCGACTDACVYNVPHVSEEKFVNDLGVTMIQKEKSHKCNACTLNQRDVPACVTTCSTGALVYGNRSALLEDAEKRLAVVKKEFPDANIYGKSEFGGLRVLTILKQKPEALNLPVGKDVIPIDVSKAESINDVYSLVSMFTLGVPSLKRTAYKIAKSLSKEA